MLRFRTGGGVLNVNCLTGTGKSMSGDALDCKPGTAEAGIGRKSWGDEGLAGKSSLLSWDLLSYVPISNCTRSCGKKTQPISRLGWKFSRMTTAPSVRQPLMPGVQPITSTRSPIQIGETSHHANLEMVSVLRQEESKFQVMTVIIAAESLSALASVRVPPSDLEQHLEAVVAQLPAILQTWVAENGSLTAAK